MAGYQALHRSGELAARAREAVARLEACALCPRACGVNRLQGERGMCGTGRLASVASFVPHFGEEAPLVGKGGSGTIFFAGCNLQCAFCQNSGISRSASAGQEATPAQLAAIMLELQGQGCHNINLVTPTHVAAQILEALPLAVDQGLTLPLVYNTSAYDAPETLALLDGVVDIYMPDAKFWDAAMAGKYCRGATDYPEAARAAIAAMHRQVGDLVLGADGMARRGLLVRHLLMPDNIAGTREWFCYLASLSPAVYVNIMDQYRPCGDAAAYPELRRTILPVEYDLAVEAALSMGLTRLDERPSSLARLLMALAKEHGLE
ncbi:MAG: radical SAM protein [Desulfovibrionaceae bacterium]